MNSLDRQQKFEKSPLRKVEETVEATFGSSTSTNSYQPGPTFPNLQIQSLENQVSELQTSNASLTTQVQALNSLVKSQLTDIKTLVDSHKQLQMQNKGEIEARLAKLRSYTQHVQDAEKSLSQEVDIDMERLIRVAEGPSLSREFDELLKALRNSLNTNLFTYKKAMDRTINSLRVILVTKDNFQEKRVVVNINDFGVDRCMQVSLNYLISRRASKLEILINKVRIVIHENTQLLVELKNAQVPAFPEAYLQPNKGIAYICPTTKHFKHFQIPKQCVMANKKLIMTLETALRDVEANLPKTQIKKDNLDDDEKKKDDQKPSSSNPSQSSKAAGSKGGERKEDEKKDGKKIKRVISLLKDKDTATRAWRSVLVEWLVAREERRARSKAEYEEKRRKYDEEIEMYIKRSEELKAKGMSRISKDGRFLNVKASSF
ncbi:hypothetical protein AgCh_009746 [Apium graveolens]